MLTTQEAYEQIRSYFSRPGAVLAKSGGYCQYRDERGNKCAVGCLIPDELYDLALDGGIILGEEMEDNNVAAIINMHPRLKEICDGDTEEGQLKLRFLTRAQAEHDDHSVKSVGLFLEELDFLAREFGLKIPA